MGPPISSDIIQDGFCWACELRNVNSLNVAWQRLEISDEEIAEATKRFQKKARFLTDEDLHAETVPFLRGKGWNVKTAVEAGLVGHSDSDYVALARKEDRLLLTHDRDYLSDRKFPLANKGGVIVLPGSSGNVRALVLGLLDMLSI